MKPSKSPKPSSIEPWPSAAFRLGLLMLIASVPTLVSAEPSRDGFTEIVPAPAVVIEHRADRRTGLRQALTAGVDLPQSASGRQRISRDQSEALNRELRETLRGVYEERSRSTR